VWESNLNQFRDEGALPTGFITLVRMRMLACVWGRALRVLRWQCQTVRAHSANKCGAHGRAVARPHAGAQGLLPSAVVSRASRRRAGPVLGWRARAAMGAILGVG
jgi:hypothetical protein